jgi:hypothetical protein
MVVIPAALSRHTEGAGQLGDDDRARVDALAGFNHANVRLRENGPPCELILRQLLLKRSRRTAAPSRFLVVAMLCSSTWCRVSR